MANKYFFCFDHAAQHLIAGSKVWMPPLDNHRSGFQAVDPVCGTEPIERMGGIDQKLSFINLKCVIGVILLFLMKQNSGILHFV
ncbi:hypothetical protein [Aristaeella hokkaidonensis]|uniref:hypothetical protein n=1 Tax=Aristaeella hokkaidonensis TaxID=3046382 RepID=UPI0024B81C89|nr:hypothetical protein [Aristaeella hokkaidonensis]